MSWGRHHFPDRLRNEAVIDGIPADLPGITDRWRRRCALDVEFHLRQDSTAEGPARCFVSTTALPRGGKPLALTPPSATPTAARQSATQMTTSEKDQQPHDRSILSIAPQREEGPMRRVSTCRLPLRSHHQPRRLHRWDCRRVQLDCHGSVDRFRPDVQAVRHRGDGSQTYEVLTAQGGHGRVARSRRCRILSERCRRRRILACASSTTTRQRSSPRSRRSRAPRTSGCPAAANSSADLFSTRDLSTRSKWPGIRWLLGSGTSPLLPGASTKLVLSDHKVLPASGIVALSSQYLAARDPRRPLPT